ncbi:MAG TPA: signal peptidase II, partial [Blastocatellia bacterium]|nr:signal peptidase II [Blastocatellia bacterium]
PGGRRLGRKPKPMNSEAEPANANSTKVWYLVVTAIVLVIDQATKYWMSMNLREGDEIEVIAGFFKFSYTENPGIAFGMLNNANVKWLLITISAAAIIVVAFYMTRTASSNRLLLWSLALLAAGISGNLVDRVRMGRVIDFILVYYKSYEWPVFNIADTAITIGAALMAIELFLPPRLERKAEDIPIDSPAVDGTQE